MLQFFYRAKNKKGFTLIELIVVVAILGILALVAIPRFANLQANAQAEANRSSATQVLNAADVFWVANQPTEPTGLAAGNLVTLKYLKSWPAGVLVLAGSGGAYSVTYTVPTGADAVKYTGTVQ